jgi:hypothetical protein
MLIALLAVLGVDLIVVVALLALVLSRKRWVKRQPGAFRGAIRVTGGEIGGLGGRNGTADTGTGSGTSSSGRRRPCCSATS